MHFNLTSKHRKLDVHYTDFMKALYKVSHRKHIHKMRVYGFGCKLIDWISAFLIGRKQRVVIGDDLPDKLTRKIKLYANDGKLIVDLRNDRDDGDVQSHINRIVKWCEAWSMEPCPEKYKGMHFVTNQ